MATKDDLDGLTLARFDGAAPYFGAVVRMYNAVWGGDSKEYALQRHMGYPGFKGIAALTEDGEVAGAIYGYTDLPGQWWHEHVARALGSRATKRWLTGSFGVAELAVRAEFRRRGLGRALLRTVLAGLPHRGATLSTQLDNAPARALYTAEGWRTLVARMRFDPSGVEYIILRRDLP